MDHPARAGRVSVGAPARGGARFVALRHAHARRPACRSTHERCAPRARQRHRRRGSCDSVGGTPLVAPRPATPRFFCQSSGALEVPHLHPTAIARGLAVIQRRSTLRERSLSNFAAQADGGRRLPARDVRDPDSGRASGRGRPASPCLVKVRGLSSCSVGVLPCDMAHRFASTRAVTPWPSTTLLPESMTTKIAGVDLDRHGRRAATNPASHHAAGGLTSSTTGSPSRSSRIGSHGPQVSLAGRSPTSATQRGLQRQRRHGFRDGPSAPRPVILARRIPKTGQRDLVASLDLPARQPTLYPPLPWSAPRRRGVHRTQQVSSRATCPCRKTRQTASAPHHPEKRSGPAPPAHSLTARPMPGRVLTIRIASGRSLPCGHRPPTSGPPAGSRDDTPPHARYLASTDKRAVTARRQVMTPRSRACGWAAEHPRSWRRGCALCPAATRAATSAGPQPS